MSFFRSPRYHLPHIPDDLTIPQFFFDYHAPSRPSRPDHVPWFIDDHSGRPVLGREVPLSVSLLLTSHSPCPGS